MQAAAVIATVVYDAANRPDIRCFLAKSFPNHKRKTHEQSRRKPVGRLDSWCMASRPKAGGFPYLAETLRRAGVTRNIWSLPVHVRACISPAPGPVVTQWNSVDLRYRR